MCGLGVGRRGKGRSLLFYIVWLKKASLIKWHLGDPKKHGNKPVEFLVKSAPSREKRQCKGPVVCLELKG